MLGHGAVPYLFFQLPFLERIFIKNTSREFTILSKKLINLVDAPCVGASRVRFHKSRERQVAWLVTQQSRKKHARHGSSTDWSSNFHNPCTVLPSSKYQAVSAWWKILTLFWAFFLLSCWVEGLRMNDFYDDLIKSRKLSYTAICFQEGWDNGWDENIVIFQRLLH